MSAEIRFSGLCVVLNPYGDPKKDIDPSVILVQTDDDGGHGHIMDDDSRHPRKHLPFISFDTKEVKVDNPTGFRPVPKALSHLYMPLDGVELLIEYDTPGHPKVLDSYKKVAQRKDYWCESENYFDRDYAPRRGDKPKKHAVKAYLRLGQKGELSAAKVANALWVFVDGDHVTKSGIYAEEILYDCLPDHRDVTMCFADLETGAAVHKVCFSPLHPYGKVSLVIGNHLEEDLAGVVQGQGGSSTTLGFSEHWVFLNLVAGLGVPGPIPIVIPIQTAMPMAMSAGPIGGGSVSGGACGPGG